jgi:hypothetical protein
MKAIKGKIALLFHLAGGISDPGKNIKKYFRVNRFYLNQFLGSHSSSSDDVFFSAKSSFLVAKKKPFRNICWPLFAPSCFAGLLVLFRFFFSTNSF